MPIAGITRTAVITHITTAATIHVDGMRTGDAIFIPAHHIAAAGDMTTAATTITPIAVETTIMVAMAKRITKKTMMMTKIRIN